MTAEDAKRIVCAAYPDAQPQIKPPGRAGNDYEHIRYWIVDDGNRRGHGDSEEEAWQDALAILRREFLNEDQWTKSEDCELKRSLKTLPPDNCDGEITILRKQDTSFEVRLEFHGLVVHKGSSKSTTVDAGKEQSWNQYTDALITAAKFRESFPHARTNLNGS